MYHELRKRGTSAATRPLVGSMSERIRAQIAAIIRDDLEAEATAGFPLLQRFPNSETAGVAGHFARLSPRDREMLLDALAYYSTVKWSHDVVRQKMAHPVLGRFLAKQPSYPPGDWYGARPKKSLLKKSVTERLANAGFARNKPLPARPADVLEFSHPDPSFAGYLLISFDPGFPRQMDVGLYDWLRGDLAKHQHRLCVCTDEVQPGHDRGVPRDVEQLEVQPLVAPEQLEQPSAIATAGVNASR